MHGVESEGYTPLHLASMRGHAVLVELLLSAGSDIGAKSLAGETPLELAKVNGHKHIVKLLRQHGAVQ